MINAVISAFTGYVAILFGTATDEIWMTICGIFLLAYSAYYIIGGINDQI